jgi:hypothetical protein
MYGRWVYTSEYGWVWVSEEPWGWVVYHYGHWVWSDRYGWVWVPGNDWGPAWVEWCYGGGYVGWTPMPPDPYWRGGYYYGSLECSSPAYYSRAVFVSEAHFSGTSIAAHVVAPSSASVAAQATVNVTSYARSANAIVNRSVDVAKLQAATGQPIKPVRVVHAKAPVQPGAGQASLREIKIYRPAPASSALPPLGDAKQPKLDLGPDTALGVRPREMLGSPSPDIPSLGRPIDAPSRSLDLGTGSGGGGLGGSGLGGVRGRLGR